MRQFTNPQDTRKRPSGVGPIGDVLAPPPNLYIQNRPPSLWRMPTDTAGQLGRNIILAGLGPAQPEGSPSTAGLSLAQRLSQNRTAQTGYSGGQSPMPSAPPAMAGATPPQPQQRSLFDVAGRFHDFQAGPKIARPNGWEELIPVVGPAWDAAADLQDGNYGSAAFNAAMAIGDALPVGYLGKAGMGAWKLGREMGTFLPKAAAIQRKLHKIGMALPTEEVHHVLALNGLGRYVPSFKNSPLFLKVLPKEAHRRLHGRWAGQPKFGLLPQLWHGTTDWMKGVAAGGVSYATDEAQNLGQWLLGQPQPKR